MIEVPVAHRPGVHVHKAGMRIPADPAALHRAGRLHGVGELVPKMHIEGAAIEVLAVFRDPEMRLREHRVGLRRAVGRQNHRLALADRLHHRGQEVEHPDIDRDLLAAVEIAEKHRELVHDPRDRTVVVTVDATKRLAGMRIGEIEPMRLRWRKRQGPKHVGQRSRAGDHRQKKSSIHRPGLKMFPPQAPVSALPRAALVSQSVTDGNSI